VSVVEPLGQIDVFAPAETVGNGLTVTTTVSLFIQPAALVPINIYNVVVAGAADGEAQFVQDRPVAGLHEYEAAPVPLSVVDAPAQIATSAPALTVGSGLTVTVTVVVPVQPTPLVPVTVYVVVAVGVAVGLAQLVQDRPVEGVQLKLLAPEAVRLVEPPIQMAVVPATVMVGVAFTDTVTLDVLEQPFASVPVTV
jgi:hypothetical protein